jgi:glycosidase
MLDMDTDHLKPHPGTDGRDFQWNDSVHLNFRKKATWDLLVSEIQEWASRGVAGIRMDAAHSWPLILKPNTYELSRGFV